MAAEDLELLATAAYLLGHVEDCLGALQRAHRLYAEGGDHRRAAWCAGWLGFHLSSRGDFAQASGWWGRASRLLEHERQEGAAAETEVAAHAGVARRYAREWLEQQAAAGYLACDDPERPAGQRRYQLPSGHAEVLLEADSPCHRSAHGHPRERRQDVAAAADGLPQRWWRPLRRPRPTTQARHRRAQPADVPLRTRQQLAARRPSPRPAIAVSPASPRV